MYLHYKKYFCYVFLLQHNYSKNLESHNKWTTLLWPTIGFADILVTDFLCNHTNIDSSI